MESIVEQAYARYRERYRRVIGADVQKLKERRAAFRADFAWNVEGVGGDSRPLDPHQAPVRFLGVWDTVDAVGLPVEELADVLNAFYRYKFPDRRLSPIVHQACHALAIDDERQTFHPLMWDESREEPGVNRLEQVWFAGVHSNVGGGYPRHGLSLAALDWMMARASDAGLRLNSAERDRYRHHGHVHDKLYDSRAGAAVYYRYGPRDVGKICRENNIGVDVHVTAAERMIRGTEGYCPGNLPSELNFVSTDRRNVPVVDKTCAEPPKLKRSLADSVGRYGHHVLFALLLLIVLWMAGASSWFVAGWMPWLIGSVAVAIAALTGLLHLQREQFAAEARAAGALLGWATGLSLIAWLAWFVPTPWWDNAWVADGWTRSQNLVLPWPDFNRPILVLGPLVAFAVLSGGYLIASRFLPADWESWWFALCVAAGCIAMLAIGTTLAIPWSGAVFIAGLLIVFHALGRWSGNRIIRDCAHAWPHHRRLALRDRLSGFQDARDVSRW